MSPQTTQPGLQRFKPSTDVNPKPCHACNQVQPLAGIEPRSYKGCTPFDDPHNRPDLDQERCAYGEQTSFADSAAFVDDALPASRMPGVLDIAVILPSHTLSEAADLWLEWLDAMAAVGSLADGTVASRRNALRYLGSLGGIRLAELKRSHVLSWGNRLPLLRDKRGLPTPSIERDAKKAVQRLLHWCEDHDACSGGIADRLPIQYRPQAGRALDRGEFDALRNQLECEDARWVAKGLDPLAIRLLRVVWDVGARCFEIRRAIGRYFNPHRRVLHWISGKAKRPRVISLGEGVAFDLIAARVRGPDDLLFPSPVTGRPFTHQYLNRLLKKIAERAGLRDPESLTIHDGRHSGATIALEEGESVEDVQFWLGHANARQTLDYLHNLLFPGAVKVGRRVAAKGGT